MRLQPVAVITLLAAVCISSTGAQTVNLVKDGDFQRENLALGTRDEPGIWVLRNHGASPASVEIVMPPDENGNHCLGYRNVGKGSHNIHVGQLVPVNPGTVYEVRARVRGDGKLEPVIAVQTKAWAILATVSCGKVTEWSEIRLLFHTFDNELVRFEWFPGAQGRLYTGTAGTSWLDDVRIQPLTDPAPALLRSFALQRPQQDRELDPRSVSVGATGNPLPLRRITARDGVLHYQDGTEVALWGVNLQTSISWEYNGRLKPAGVPHTAEALKEITSRNLDQMPLVGVGIVRVHLLPADFSGPDGEIRDTIYLDVLDDLLAQCRKRGIYVYLTLMNEMNDRFCSDSFVVGHERVEWLFDPSLAAKSRRYVHEFLNRENRYTGKRYADDSTIAVIEILNEPDYPSLQDLRSKASLQACSERFDSWMRDQPGDATPEAIYPAYRYEQVRDYLDRICTTVRATGCPAPVVWNLNWPRMIRDHEDVFQAAADSDIDGVSFCCYPGQSDVAHPFWANAADLSANNYLPYLQTCYRDYSYLRWMLGTRFEAKAKMAYEFESMYNHSAYLYPAMASLFRSLGAQIAPMWQYTLSPVAEYRAGSHYLNAYCTPRKAVSFRIASRVFAATPRYTPFDMDAKTEMAGPEWALSFERDLSLRHGDATFMHSDDVDWNPLGIPRAPRIIVGCGNSPLVTYGGTGLYVLEFAGDRAELLILPDVRYTYPTWQRKGPRPLQRVCELDADASNVFQLHLAGWTDGVELARLEGDQTIPLTTDGPGTRFLAVPGQYRLTRTTSEKP